MKCLTRNQKFGLLIFFCLITIYLNFRAVNQISIIPDYKKNCDLKTAKYIIENLCDLYSNQKLIIGSMCSTLCNPKNKLIHYNEYELVGCYNGKNLKDSNSHLSYNQFYEGLKTVLVYEILDSANSNKTGKKFVFKSSHKSFLDFDTRLEYDFNEKSIHTQLKYLLTYIRSALFTNFGIRVDKDAVDSVSKFSNNPEIFKEKNKKDLNYYVMMLSAENFDYFKQAVLSEDKKKLAIFITNLMVLLNQEEYLFYKYFQDKPESLKIGGSCGNFYAVEHAESLNRKIRYMEWSKRLELTKKFLVLVSNLDRNYLYGSISSKKKTLDEELSANDFQITENVSYPLQICDVKLDNFGINEKNELKIIDTDMIKPNSYLFQPKFCNKHDDCHFFECKGFCEKNHCIERRINNNLQSICEHIFDNKLDEDALISNRKELNKTNPLLVKYLDMCKLPGLFKNSDIPVEADKSLIKKLSNSF